MVKKTKLSPLDEALEMVRLAKAKDRRLELRRILTGSHGAIAADEMVGKLNASEIEQALREYACAGIEWSGDGATDVHSE